MTVKELKDYLNDFDDQDEVLIFPEDVEGHDEDGNEITQEPGIGVYKKNPGELYYIGEVQLIQMTDFSEEE